MNLTVTEHKSDAYGPRTYFNAGFSDLTVAFAVNFNTYGEILTEKASKGNIVQFDISKEDFDPVKAARKLYSIMNKNGFKTLNIAGNGIYTLHAYNVTQTLINELVYKTLEPVHKHLGIHQIRSGGQTGADIAGAVAGVVLEIPTIVTYPKGYRQRLIDGADIIQSHDEAQDTILRYVEQL